MKRLVGIIGIVYLLCFLAAPIEAFEDEYPRAQSLFARGQRLTRERDFSSAIDALQELVTGFKNSKYRDIYNYALARAYYLSGDFENADLALGNYPTLFPNSSLTPYALHLHGNIAYRLRQLEKAFLFYAEAYQKTGDNRLRQLSRRSLLAEVEAGYIPSDSVLAQVPRDLECPLKSRIAFLMKSVWNPQELEVYLGECPGSKEVSETGMPRLSNEPALGVLLPLSGSYAKYGQAVLDGVILAVDELKKQGLQLEVLAYDTRADHVVAARAALALAEADVELVIGPLLSSIAATTAAVLSSHGIPLLVPAASQAGFTDLSPDCFQMSPNMETIGRGLAQYAVRTRGMTTLAVITPTAADELTMADAFASEVRRLGANMLAVEKFRSGETDFGPYINDIKETILGPADDSAFYVTLSGDTLRVSEIPVALDGLFVPATEDQLYLLLPQLNFYRVTTSYLGTSEWDTEKVLKLGEKVLMNAVFYSSDGAMRNSPAFESFAAAFDVRYGAEPTRLAALGFDAVNLLADAHRQGQKGPEAVSLFLKSLSGYNGASGQITFGGTRSNLQLPLFNVKEDQVKPLFEQSKVEELFPQETARPDSVGVENNMNER